MRHAATIVKSNSPVSLPQMLFVLLQFLGISSYFVLDSNVFDRHF